MTSDANQTPPPVVLPTLERQPMLPGQKALVTGASSGIGMQVAIALGHAGADVIVNYRSDPEAAEAAVDEIERRCGVKALALKADVSEEDQVQAMSRPCSMSSRHHRHPGQQRRPAAGRAVRRTDPETVEHGDQR